MAPVDTIYTLPMADISLWAGDESTGPITKLWTAQQQASLQIKAIADVVERRLTGMPHPRRHIRITGYEISLGGVFNEAIQVIEDGEYILIVRFNEAALHSSGLRWLSQTFYGVQILNTDKGADAVDPLKGSAQLVANLVEDETSP